MKNYHLAYYVNASINTDYEEHEGHLELVIYLRPFTYFIFEKGDSHSFYDLITVKQISIQIIQSTEPSCLSCLKPMKM